MLASAARRLTAVLFAARASDDQRRFEAEIRDPELVFRRYFEEIYRYCRRRLASDADAEDVCAQVFADALAAVPKLHWRGRPVLAFLYTVASRRVVDHIRVRARETLDADVGAGLAVVDAEAHDLPGQDELGQALAELPEHIRLCVYLRVVAGYSSDEIAAVVGRSEKACRNLVSRGLAQLRATLAAEGGVTS